MPGGGGGMGIPAQEEVDTSDEAIFEAAIEEAIDERRLEEFRSKLANKGGFKHIGSLECLWDFMLRPRDASNEDPRFGELHAYFTEQVTKLQTDLYAESRRIFGADVLTPGDVAELMIEADTRTDNWLAEKLKPQGESDTP